MKEKIAKILVLGFMLTPLLQPFTVAASFDQSAAQNYLVAHSDNPWSTMALEALGYDVVPLDYLKNISASSAIQYSAPIMALTSAGKNPRTFGSQDLIAKLESFHTGNQIGDASTVNDDIFGLLALVSAGINDATVSDAKNFILSHQSANGGWGFTLTSNPDSNMTATAIVALIAAGVSKNNSQIQNGFQFLKTAQNDDGGFTYDPISQFGTDSDSSSTAWAIWALNAADINPADWTKGSNTPITYLQSNQASSGYFKYQSSSSEDAFSATTTAYAVIALIGRTLPIKIQQPAPNPTPTPIDDGKFSFRIEGKNSQVCAGKADGPTALDIVKNASKVCNFTYHIQDTSFGPYLDQINDDAAAGLIGWLYLVNFQSAQVGAADYQLQPDDTVLWYYGDYTWKPTSLTLSSGKVDSGETVSVEVKSFDGKNWTALPDAKINYGAFSATTDSSGNAQINAPDGNYKVFAEKDGFIRSNSETLTVGKTSNNDISLHVNVSKVLGTVLSFSVNTNELDFGDLSSGENEDKNFNVTNTGDVDFTLKDQVSGDNVFLNGLKLNNSIWQDFSAVVNKSENKNVTATLSIPQNYSGTEGNKNGTLTLWAVAQ